MMSAIRSLRTPQASFCFAPPGLVRTCRRCAAAGDRFGPDGFQRRCRHHLEPRGAVGELFAYQPYGAARGCADDRRRLDRDRERRSRRHAEFEHYAAIDLQRHWGGKSSSPGAASAVAASARPLSSLEARTVPVAPSSSALASFHSSISTAIKGFAPAMAAASNLARAYAALGRKAEARLLFERIDRQSVDMLNELNELRIKQIMQ